MLGRLCWFHITTCHDPVFRKWPCHQVGRLRSTSRVFVKKVISCRIYWFKRVQSPSLQCNAFFFKCHLSLCVSCESPPFSSLNPFSEKNGLFVVTSGKWRWYKRNGKGIFSKRGCKCADMTHLYHETLRHRRRHALQRERKRENGALALRNGTRNKRVTKESERLEKCWTRVGPKEREIAMPPVGAFQKSHLLR